MIYGRGTMDMKCGIALELDIIEEFAANRELYDVNIVAAFVGDEENASAGMRGVLPVLSKMKEEGTDFLTAINTEPGEAGHSGESGPIIFLGTLGKLMPSFYVRGLPMSATITAVFHQLWLSPGSYHILRAIPILLTRLTENASHPGYALIWH